MLSTWRGSWSRGSVAQYLRLRLETFSSRRNGWIMRVKKKRNFTNRWSPWPIRDRRKFNGSFLKRFKITRKVSLIRRVRWKFQVEPRLVEEKPLSLDSLRDRIDRSINGENCARFETLHELYPRVRVDQIEWRYRRWIIQIGQCFTSGLRWHIDAMFKTFGRATGRWWIECVSE